MAKSYKELTKNANRELKVNLAGKEEQQTFTKIQRRQGQLQMPQEHAKLSKHQMKELREAFDLFDRDQSGSISSAELKQLLIALNFKPTESLLRKVMKEMDTDGNGSIEFEEFVKVMASVYARKLTDEEMHRAFKCFDKDNSGFITREELRDVLRHLNQNINEKRIAAVLNEIDSNHDGKISYDEFVHMLQDM